MINKVTLIGHLGQDPELRKLENGTAVSRFSLATNEVYKDASGEQKEQTEWHNIVVWRQLAELAERLLKKGTLVYVEGKISYRKYTDKNGIERTVTDIVASTFRLMGKKEGSGARENNFPNQEPNMQRGGQGVVTEAAYEPSAPVGDMPEQDNDLPF